MKTIIKREFLEHLQSLQFYVLLIFSIILFGISGWVSVNNYNEQNSAYNKNITDLTKHPSTISTQCYRKPNGLAFIADGGLKTESDGVRLGPKSSISNHPSGERNFKMPNIPELDWAFIIKVVFSLYVILLAFNGISGEKEQGTLGIIISNSIRRSQVLLGKYISIILTVLIPLLLGGIVSLLIAVLFIPQVFNFIVLLRVLLMLVLTIVYLSVFIFLGLLMSALIQRSSLVLLVLLAAWICFAFIIPNTLGILSDKFTEIPSEHQTAEQMGPMVQQEVWSKIAMIINRADQGEFETKEQILAETDVAFEEAQGKVRQYYNSFRNAMKRRSDIARKLSRISPTALFQYASEGIANSGPLRQEHFMENVMTYSRIYDDYIKNKVGKVVGVSNWSFSTSMMFKDEHVHISSPSPKEYQGDKSDFPFFEEEPPDLPRNFREAVFDISGLLLWVVILAFLAFAAVARCDVR